MAPMSKQDRGVFFVLRILTLPEVEAATGYSRTTIWRREQAGEFPKRRRIGPHLVAWRSDEIEAWIETRPVADAEPSVSAPEDQ